LGGHGGWMPGGGCELRWLSIVNGQLSIVGRAMRVFFLRLGGRVGRLVTVELGGLGHVGT
jgi:hypothetical protein